MIVKLVKYEIRASALWMLGTYGIFAIIGIVIPPILKVFQLNKAFSYWSSFIPKIIIIMVISVFYFIIDRYISSLYGYETPLMFGIPVKGRYLLLSKVINAFIWITAGFLLVITSGYIMLFLSQPFEQTVTDMVRLFNNFGIILLKMVSGFLLYAVVSILLIMQFYFSITVSKIKIWGKFSAIIGILTFLFILFLEVLFSICVNIWGNTLLWLTDSLNWGRILVPILAAVALTAGMFIATTVLIEKRTSFK